MNAALSVVGLSTGFRAAMRRIAATVTIVTADDGERYHGMTATAVTSLSMEPPSLLVCINKKAFLHDILLRAGNFCINVLHQDQAELSAAFSGAGVIPGPLRCWQVGEVCRRPALSHRRAGSPVLPQS